MRTASAFHCCGQQDGYFRTASMWRRWGLKPDYPMALNYSAQRQALAKQIGLDVCLTRGRDAGDAHADRDPIGRKPALITGSVRTTSA